MGEYYFLIGLFLAGVTLYYVVRKLEIKVNRQNYMELMLIGSLGILLFIMIWPFAVGVASARQYEMYLKARRKHYIDHDINF